MKILYFTTFDLTLAKGPSINEREFLGGLLRHPCIEARAVVPRTAIHLGELPTNQIHQIRHAWGASAINIIASELEVGNAIRHELDKFKPDIVVGRLSLLPFGSYLALRYSKTPFAIKTLGSFGFLANGWKLTQILTRCLRPLSRFLLRRAVRRASVIDTVTEQLRSLHIRNVRICSETIIVVPNSTNTKRFKPQDSHKMRLSLGLKENSVVVGYTGGAPLERGGREVIRAVSRLRNSGVDAYGVVVGGEVSELHRFSMKYGVSNYLIVPGRIDYTNMPKWINLIDIGIALDNKQRYERSGNSYQKVRQFIACGRFIISILDDSDPITNCPLVVRLVKNNDETIFTAIQSILSLSEQKREQLQKSGREFAVKYFSSREALRTRIELWENYILKNRVMNI